MTTTASETLALAVQHHQAGRLQAAEQLYQQTLALAPSQADAWHLLGVLNTQLGRHEAGMDCLHRAISLRPDWPEALYNLGWALRQQGKSEDAAICFRRAIERKPDYVEAHDSLGVALQELGKLDQAVACHRRALQLNPEYVAAFNNLGLALAARADLDHAAACYEQAIQRKPDFAAAYDNLGSVRAKQGRLMEAVASFRRAAELDPDNASIHCGLGNALWLSGDLDEAAACYRRAIELKPDYTAAYDNLGNICTRQGRLTEAVACFRRALEFEPDAPHVLYALGNALALSGRLDEALACHRPAIELKRDDAMGHSTLLCTLQYRTSMTLQELAEAHAEFEQRHCAPLRATWRPHENVRDPDRCLRVGFVSRYFQRHPVGYFLIRLLENLDRRQCEAVCYHDGRTCDDLTARFQAAATTWHDVRGWTDERLAEQIRGDRIDILFDLAGHVARNRLLVFARKPAPIQVTWADYVGTTGLAAMDYILADRYEIPPQSEVYYQERVLRMPDGYICYDPPDYAPSVSPLPAMEKGYVTFSAFHYPPKVTSQAVEVWAQILKRLPRARLVLKYRGMDDASVAGRLRDLFAAQGIDPARLEFLGYSANRELLAEYQRVDIALDTFPYNGGLTTCEALWMGVPVVTCPGETFASRHSLSHMSNAGLPETIAGDLRQYVEIAVSLASDLPRLAALRAGLRERMAASPLCDGKRFAENFARILRGAWRDWCEKDSEFRVQSRIPDPRTLNPEP